MRSSGRNELGLRNLSFEPHFVKHAEGSCLIRMGQTWVLCTASIEEKVPPFLDGKNIGWITAEYGMLPRATHTRTRREASSGKPSGRTQEIQRLIGRALRACVDRSLLGVRTITIDCDVIQADGGTRIASINGGFVALALAISWLKQRNKISASPILSTVAGISLGMKEQEILLDLDYQEDSTCDVDMNVVMLEQGKIVELQGTGENSTFSMEDTQRILIRAKQAIDLIMVHQKKACNG